MAGGDVCKSTFTRVYEPSAKIERLDIPLFSQKECCFKLPVFAEPLIVTDDAKNDIHSVLKFYDKNLYLGVLMVLQKYENGDWVDTANLFSDNYGKFYNFGFAANTENNLFFVGYRIEWQKVLDEFGEGTYRVKFNEFQVGGIETESFYDFEFCLRNYMPYRADRTVRFSFYTKGYRGDFQDDLTIWDFTNVAKYVEIFEGNFDGWFNQMRLPDSWFGDNRSEYEREYIRYSNGQQVWVQDEQIEKYSFHSGMFPSLLHDYIKTNIIQADRITVNDYNSKNPNVIVNRAIKPDGGYEPSWNYNNLKAMVSVDFVQEYQNRRKKRC